MMLKNSAFVLILLFFSLSFVSAQWIEAENFIEVSSAQAGSQDEGCFVASMSGMLISLNHSKIGTNPEPVIAGMKKELCPPDQWPAPSYDVLSAVLRFLLGVL